HAIPDLVADLRGTRDQARRPLHRRHAEGVVVQKVEPAEFTGRPRDHHIDIGGARDVRGDRDSLAAGRRDLIHDLLRIVAVDIDDRDRPAARGETAGRRATDSGTRAGYQSYFAVKAHR